MNKFCARSPSALEFQTKNPTSSAKHVKRLTFTDNLDEIRDEAYRNNHYLMDIPYMKILRTFLRLLCSWPHEVLGEEAEPIPLRSPYFLLFEGLFCTFGGVTYVRNNYKEFTFLEMGQTYLTIFLGAVAAQRVTISWFQSFNDLMKEFLQKGHLYQHKHKSEYSEQVHQKIQRICHLFAICVVAEVYFVIVLFNGPPVYNNIKNGMFNEKQKIGKRFEYSINYELPYVDQRTNLIVYIVTALFNLLFSCDCGACFSCFDLTISIIVFHIWGHLKILDHELHSILPPAAMRDQSARSDELFFYSKEENKQVAAKLKDIVDHHRMIMSLVNKTSTAFGPTLCFYYLFLQVSGCVLLLECSEMDTDSLTRYVPMSAVIFQLFIQISVIVELLGSQSDTLKDAVYSIPWECMDTSNRRIVLFLLYNVHEPIRLKPLGMVSVGVQTMAAILKTTFSYFMLLRSFE